ncbi:MAG: hypothetical protein IJ389_00935 [Clostridia bacterium]|nr:hypothetical protein [Clostridia bacterium]
MANKSSFVKRWTFVALAAVAAVSVAVAVAIAAKHEGDGSDVLKGSGPLETNKGAIIPLPDTTDEEATTVEPEAETKSPETTEPVTSAPETTVPVTTVPDTTAPVTTIPPVEVPEPGEKRFENCLFIGDSRTAGMSIYADLGEATVFASRGMNVFRVFKEPLVVPRMGSMMLEDVLKLKKYDKVYVMLGINEMGYPTDGVVKEYKKLVDRIREEQPEATIYIQANLHITTSRSNSDRIYNNAKLNELNAHLKAMCDGDKIVYMDVNPIFDDATGGLSKEYAHDDFHLISKYYAVWADWILQNS